MVTVPLHRAVIHPFFSSKTEISPSVCSGDEMDEKRQLDEQMRAVMDKFKYKRRQIRELQDDLHVSLYGLENRMKFILSFADTQVVS